MNALFIILAILIILIFGIWRFRQYRQPIRKTSRFSGPHDCGMRALLVVRPDLSHDTIENAFMQCADNWPNGGVTNVEFNVALRFMKLFDRFLYDASPNQVMGDFLSDKTGSYILLVHGHFTTIKEGRVVDSVFLANPNPKQGVYCSWKSIS